MLACLVLLALFGPGGLVASQSAATPSAFTSAVTVLPESTPTQATQWAVTFEYLFPTQTWAPGEHEYVIESTCPSFSTASGTWTVRFEVAQASSFHSGYVYLRTRGISLSPHDNAFLQSVHPDQPLAASFTILLPTREMTELAGADCSVAVSLDESDPQELIPLGPVER